MFALLENLTADNAEQRYQAFYPACNNGEITLETARALYARIGQIYQTSDHPVIQSYCWLFYGAVVDSKLLPPPDLSDLCSALDKSLDELTDFRTKDKTGRYVHFLSHATYLIQSIHDAGGHTSWQAIARAYLRAEMVFEWHENIVLADCLLQITSPDNFGDLLRLLQTGQATGAKATNQRALWMAMLVLNSKNHLQDASVFDTLINEVVTIVS